MINAKWWRQWCDYVNFEAQTPKAAKEQPQNNKFNFEDERTEILKKLHSGLQREDL